ncbi:MAG TPA: hypothetical protein VGA13_06860 [Acidimicrobiales bacterium]
MTQTNASPGHRASRWLLGLGVFILATGAVLPVHAASQKYIEFAFVFSDGHAESGVATSNTWPIHGMAIHVSCSDTFLGPDNQPGTADDGYSSAGAQPEWNDGNPADPAVVAVFINKWHTDKDGLPTTPQPPCENNFGDTQPPTNTTEPPATTTTTTEGPTTTTTTEPPAKTTTTTTTSEAPGITTTTEGPAAATDAQPTTTIATDVAGLQAEATASTTSTIDTEVLGVQVDAAPAALATTGVETRDLLLIAGLAITLGALAVRYGEQTPLTQRD